MAVAPGKQPGPKSPCYGLCSGSSPSRMLAIGVERASLQPLSPRHISLAPVAPVKGLHVNKKPGIASVVSLHGAQEVLTGISEEESQAAAAPSTAGGDAELQLGGDLMPLGLAILDPAQQPSGASAAAATTTHAAVSSVVTVIPSPHTPAHDQPTQQGGSSDTDPGTPKHDGGDEPQSSQKHEAGDQQESENKEQQQQEGDGQHNRLRGHPVWRKPHLPPPPPQRFPPVTYTADQLVPGPDLHLYDYPTPYGSAPGEGRFRRVARRPLAGGTLEVIRWEGSRMLRVWLPPGFDAEEEGPRMGGYPAVFMHDGQNLFTPDLCASMTCWQVAETASELIRTGRLSPFVVVGIDHPGQARPYEYTPVRPGTGPEGWRSDAAQWPGGGVWSYLERLAGEVVPWVTQAYSLSDRPGDRVLGGSSFGGIATLCAAMKYPDVWGNSLVESPSLWIDEGRFLKEVVAAHSGPWTGRAWLGMGGKEHTGVRSKAEGRPQLDSWLVKAVQELKGVMATKAGLLEGHSLALEVAGEATHTEKAWAERLPQALTFLCSHWWQRALRSKQGHLYFTVPRRLRPGAPGVLLVNRHKSSTLHSCNSLTLHAGFNANWDIKVPDTPLQKAAWIKEGPDTWELSASGSSNHNGHQHNKAERDGDWWVAPLEVPQDAYELHFVLSGAAPGGGKKQHQNQNDSRLWDNNAGSNFYLRLGAPAPVVKDEPAPTAVVSGNTFSAVLSQVKQALSQHHQDIANKNSSKTFFTVPEVLVAGMPARVYFNRARPKGFLHSPNVKMHFGWNGWDDKVLPGGAAKADFKPTTLWRGEGLDWWGSDIMVPEAAVELNCAFTDGGQLWDSNNGHNYSAPVISIPRDDPSTAGAETSGMSDDDEEPVSATPLGPKPRPRVIESVESMPHGAGTMHIVTLAKRDPKDPRVTRQMRWADERLLRVWTPPGWSLEKTPPGGWPVLYLSDGQNKFEDWLAHQGVSWRAGYQASDLVTRGELPPFLVVGIDSPGPMRSLNYLPYAPGTGLGGFRGDCERWPGGGVSLYMQRVTEEILPLVQLKYGAAADPSRVAFGGGSFGGVCALYVAMHYPHLFGSILAESPSLWISEGRFLGDMGAHKGQLAERVFLGCGTREYSATRDHERCDVDGLLLHYCSEAARILDEKGCKGGHGRLKFHVEQDAGHHEGAWQWRFSGALRFLLSPWWDHFRP